MHLRRVQRQPGLQSEQNSESYVEKSHFKEEEEEEEEGKDGGGAGGEEN